jgi:hypothetical protein
MSVSRILLLLFCFCSSFSAIAQYTDVINSNRPGASKSAFSVGTNVLQFELGGRSVKEEHVPLQYEVSGFGLDFSARYGLFFEQLEINLDVDYQNDTFTNNSSSIPSEISRANFRNVAIGANYLIYDPNKSTEAAEPNLRSYHANKRFQWNWLIPAVAVYAGANFDSENNPYTAPGIEGFSPKVRLATQNNFFNGWVYVMNFTYDRIGTDDPIFEYILTLTKSINQNWVAFGEIQGINSDFYGDNLIRVGGAYLFNKNFQLDGNLTFNTKDTPSVFNINFGASYRFDFHDDSKAIEKAKLKALEKQQKANY